MPKAHTDAQLPDPKRDARLAARSTLARITQSQAAQCNTELTQRLANLILPKTSWLLYAPRPASQTTPHPEAGPTTHIHALAHPTTLAYPTVEWHTRTLTPRVFSTPHPSFITVRHNIPEPDPAHSAPIDPDTIDAVAVPGLAFTSTGARLGQGGGFYDRFLADHPRALRVALAFDCQLVQSIPTDPHDQTVDAIVTPTRTLTTTTQRDSVDFSRIRPIRSD